jgi:predicted small secreted protein
MGRRRLVRFLALALVAAFALGTAGCNATVGVGVSVGYPGPYYGPWGGGVYGGYPLWP